jgi:hypothetical protein
MSDLTKHRSSHNPWATGFPFLWVPGTPSGLPRREGRLPPRERRSWLLAVRCRMRRKAIDKELAAGVDPDSTECRHRRASELTGPRNRQALAAALERHIAAATSIPPLDVLPVNWRGVHTASPRLERLAQRLREDPQVRAQAVARVQLLLTDGDSALYAKGDDMSLASEVRSTLALL